MGLFDRIKQWAQTSDEERVELDRRAFLKGLTVTGAGLLIPGAAVFDMGRRGRGAITCPRPDFEFIEASWVKIPLVGFSVYETLGIGTYNPKALARLEVTR